MAEDAARELPNLSLAGHETLGAGASARLIADLPFTEPEELVEVWIEWEDERGERRVSAGRVAGSRRPNGHRDS